MKLYAHIVWECEAIKNHGTYSSILDKCYAISTKVIHFLPHLGARNQEQFDYFN